MPALEIGGSHVTVAGVDLARGSIITGSCHTEPLNPAGSAEEILGAIVVCGRMVRAGQGEGWGIALPGPFDYQRGVGLFEGVGKFEALYGVDVRGVLEDELPGPPASITFVNDAEAFMWGERLYGAAAGYARCVGITLGTGIGSAFFADGEVCRSGAGVPPEGRVDLLQIDGSPLEDIISTRALLREYHRQAGATVEGGADLARRARAGEEPAATVVSTAFARFGAALQPWLETFGAQALVVGGAMTGSWDVVWPALAQGLRAARPGFLEELTVVVAERPAEAALLGAAAWARSCTGRQRKAGGVEGTAVP